MALIHDLKTAWHAHEPEAREAYRLFKSWAPRTQRVPGCDTPLRLALRIWHGKTIEQAAAREYLYRWNLALDNLRIHTGDGTAAPLADHYAPHLLGM